MGPPPPQVTADGTPARSVDDRPTATLRCAVVGLGYWGPNLLRALIELSDAEVAMACDLDRERCDRFRTRYPGVPMTQSVDDVLEDGSIDAVFIATPVFTHFDLAARSLASGKHTFVEKPLAPSSAQAEALVALAQVRDLVLMCGHTFLYSPPVRSVKRLIDEGDLGDIHFISSSRVNLGLHQRDVSVVWDLAPHDFSIFLYWMGEMPEWIRAVGRDSVVRNIFDVAFIDMSFGSGTLGHVELSWLAPSKLRRTVIVGSEKMVVYDDTSPEALRVFDSGVVYRDPETFGEYQLSYRTGDIVSPRLDTIEPIVAELSDFVALTRGGDARSPSPTFACNVVRLIEATERSMRTSGETVPIARAPW